MPIQDHATYREWTYLLHDQGLDARQERELHLHLESCAECRAEVDSAEELHSLMSGTRIEPRGAFRREVMAGLAPAGWEARHPRSWVGAAVLFVLLAGGAVAATLLGPAQPTAPLVAALGAVANLLQNAALAGAGLLAASWQGLGGTVRDALGGSPLPLAVFGLLILGIDVLFLRLLLKARARRKVAAERRPDR